MLMIAMMWRQLAVLVFGIASLVLSWMPSKAWGQGSGTPTQALDPAQGQSAKLVMSVSESTGNQTSGPIFAPSDAMGVYFVIDVSQCDSTCTFDLAIQGSHQALCSGGDRDGLVCYTDSNCFDSDVTSGTDGTCLVDSAINMINNVGGSQAINATGNWFVTIYPVNTADITAPNGSRGAWEEGYIPPVFNILVDQDAGTASYDIYLRWLK